MPSWRSEPSIVKVPEWLEALRRRSLGARPPPFPAGEDARRGRELQTAPAERTPLPVELAQAAATDSGNMLRKRSLNFCRKREIGRSTRPCSITRCDLEYRHFFWPMTFLSGSLILLLSLLHKQKIGKHSFPLLLYGVDCHLLLE